jgi:hypothetical protein
MVCSPSINDLRRGRTAAEVSLLECGQAAVLPSIWPDIRGRRTRDGNPTRLHGLRQLADQFDPEQAVVERRSLDLNVVRQIELPLERPRRNPLIQEFALLFLGLPAFHGQDALFCGDLDFVR